MQISLENSHLSHECRKDIRVFRGAEGYKTGIIASLFTSWTSQCYLLPKSQEKDILSTRTTAAWMMQKKTATALSSGPLSNRLTCCPKDFCKLPSAHEKLYFPKLTTALHLVSCSSSNIKKQIIFSLSLNPNRLFIVVANNRLRQK